MISSSSSSAARVYRTSVFSRERNRMHARKTRQRKKEHVQKLQDRVDRLKAEQLRLRLAVSEKHTASILVDLFQAGGGDGGGGRGAAAGDPRVEALLRRPADDIPDASKIPELPALILPGGGKRKAPPGDGGRRPADGGAEDVGETPGVDYALLGKDRAACSPAELDRMRRERNRMHAKRTRDRKRIFTEELEAIVDQLEGENSLLRGHLDALDSRESPPEKVSSLPQTVSPALGPVATPSSPAAAASEETIGGKNANGDFLSQIESLLAAAGSFRKRSVECDTNAVSCAESDDRSDRHSLDEEDDDYRTDRQLSGSFPNQRPRRTTSNPSPSVPKSITTTNLSLG